MPLYGRVEPILQSETERARESVQGATTLWSPAQARGQEVVRPAAFDAAFRGGLVGRASAMLEPREGSGPPQQVSLQEGFRDPERHQRWAGLFEQLDTNKDGRVDINELREGLARMGMEASPQAEQVSGGRQGWTEHRSAVDR